MRLEREVVASTIYVLCALTQRDTTLGPDVALGAVAKERAIGLVSEAFAGARVAAAGVAGIAALGNRAGAPVATWRP